MIAHKLNKRLIGRRLNVSVAGCGGNGSQFLTGLARMDVALRATDHPGLHVIAWDPDIVTEANVGRQLFSPGDIGQHKASVLIHRINCFFGLNWKVAPVCYDRPSSHGKQADFLVGCVDSVAARRGFLSRCERATYWLDLGNSTRTGQVILGAPKHPWNSEDPQRPLTFFEIFPELARGKIREDKTPSCSLAEAIGKQDLFINQSVVTWGLHLMWNFIRTGHLVQQGYFINLETGKVAPIIVPQPAPNVPSPVIIQKPRHPKRKKKS